MPFRDVSKAGEFLRKGPWFGSLSAEVQQALLAEAQLRTFPRGQVLQIEGDSGRGLVAVLEGSVTLTRHVGDTTALVHVAEPGFWFGQLSVLGTPTVVGAVARTTLQLLLLSRAGYLRIAARHAELADALHAACFHNADQMFGLQAEGRYLTPDAIVPARLAFLAARRLEDLGQHAGPVALSLTQAELADMVGLARQQVNPRLKALEAEGLVRLAKGQIIVWDPLALRRLSTVTRRAPTVSPAPDRAARPAGPGGADDSPGVG